MLSAISIILFISILSFAYGIITLHAFGVKGITIKMPVIVLIGMAAITSLAVISSCFFPLQGPLPHLILLIPALIFYFMNKRRLNLLVLTFCREIADLRTNLQFLLAAVLLMVLVMFPHTISHPDTLTYHAQLIQWSEKFTVVPGIANLHPNYGLQSNWFVSAALWRFKFLGTNALTYANITAVIWFLIFIFLKLDNSLGKNVQLLNKFLPWFLILIFSLTAYTQVRLTITSASPDFIACIFMWLVFYLFINQSHENSGYLNLILFLSCFCVAIKLSAIPILLAPLIVFVQSGKKKWQKKLISCFLIAVLTISPQLYRNYLASGFPLYPSTLIHFKDADWSVGNAEANLIADYVTSYARLKTNSEPSIVEQTINLGVTAWVPVWWNALSIADKIILSLALLCFVMLMIFIRKFATFREAFALAIMILGMIFWFRLAPDPRFGYGFIIPFIVIVLSTALPELKTTERAQKIQATCIYITLAFTLGYTVYRAKNYFKPVNLIRSSGVIETPFEPISCSGKPFSFSGNNYCADNPIPCTYRPCEGVVLRGTAIEQGFKKANR